MIESVAGFIIAAPTPCTLRAAISDAAPVKEGDAGTSNAVFTVSLSAPTSQPVTVRWATADSTATTGDNDYKADSGTVTFPANSATPYRDELFGPDFATSVFVSEPVYNLIHREVLESDGITFTSHRTADEKESE